MLRPAPRMPQKATRPERRLEAALKHAGAPLGEVERNPTDLACRPDLFWRHRYLAVFVDGCAWHGCPEHGRRLDDGRAARQRVADRLNRTAMQALGFKVLSFWEHEVAADAAGCAARVLAALGGNGGAT